MTNFHFDESMNGDLLADEAPNVTGGVKHSSKFPSYCRVMRHSP